MYLPMVSHAAALARSAAAFDVERAVDAPGDVTAYQWAVIDHPTNGTALLGINERQDLLTPSEVASLIYEAAAKALGFMPDPYK